MKEEKKQSLYAVIIVFDVWLRVCCNRYFMPAQFLYTCLECKGHQHNKRTKIITMIMICDCAYIVSFIVVVVVLFQIWLCSPQLNAKAKLRMKYT